MEQRESDVFFGFNRKTHKMRIERPAYCHFRHNTIRVSIGRLIK